MLHLIRLAMQGKDRGEIGGEVEVDETFVAGLSRNMHKPKHQRGGMTPSRTMTGKVTVMALIDRHGKDGMSQVRTEVLSGRKRCTLQGHVGEPSRKVRPSAPTRSCPTEGCAEVTSTAWRTTRSATWTGRSTPADARTSGAC